MGLEFSEGHGDVEVKDMKTPETPLTRTHAICDWAEGSECQSAGL